MLQELEKIAFIPTWIAKIKAQKNNQFIRLLPNSSAKNFTLLVLEEYMLLLIIMLICWQTQVLNLYFTIMLAYNLDILIHVAQALLLQSYVPSLNLGIISFLITSGMLWQDSHLVNPEKVFLFLPFIIVLIAANLLLIHKWFKF